MAGYIQDQFTFEDLFFNVGVRVDALMRTNRFCRSLCCTQYIKWANRRNFQRYNVPEECSDAVVYVDDQENPSSIVGYRDGFIGTQQQVRWKPTQKNCRFEWGYQAILDQPRN